MVESRDPAAYAREVAGLIAQPERLARFAQGAREHASRLGWSVTVDQLLSLYAGAMAEATQAVA
jgi:D-inositol-3-phosphate glycosyltransferase